MPCTSDANINVQMNYWAAETTNLDVSMSLFDYMEVSKAKISIRVSYFVILENMGTERRSYRASSLQYFARMGNA